MNFAKTRPLAKRRRKPPAGCMHHWTTEDCPAPPVWFERTRFYRRQYCAGHCAAGDSLDALRGIVDFIAFIAKEQP